MYSNDFSSKKIKEKKIVIQILLCTNLYVSVASSRKRKWIETLSNIENLDGPIFYNSKV